MATVNNDNNNNKDHWSQIITKKEKKNIATMKILKYCSDGGLVTKSCLTLATPWTGACQAPLSMRSPGKNTGVGCHFLLQGIVTTQALNPGLWHCRQNLY